MKQKIITKRCEECKVEFETIHRWYGDDECCPTCIKRISDERVKRDYCKRHGGKKGLDCYPCKLEGMF